MGSDFYPNTIIFSPPKQTEHLCFVVQESRLIPDARQKWIFAPKEKERRQCTTSTAIVARSVRDEPRYSLLSLLIKASHIRIRIFNHHRPPSKYFSAPVC